MITSSRNRTRLRQVMVVGIIRMCLGIPFQSRVSLIRRTMVSSRVMGRGRIVVVRRSIIGIVVVATIVRVTIDELG